MINELQIPPKSETMDAFFNRETGVWITREDAIKTLICRSPSCKGECGGTYESEE